MNSSAPLTSNQLLKAARSFHTKKRLGQHFLVDSDTLDTIAETLEVAPDDTIVEIGCGTGFLTRVLNKFGRPVVAIDLDRESVEEVKSLQLQNVTAIHGDFLNFNLSKLVLKRHELAEVNSELEQVEPKSLRVVGNVPYQITGLIIGHILGEIGQAAPWLSTVKKIVLTVQYEVALRMVAPPGSKNYSQLSLLMQYFGQPELKLQLGAEKFFPVPEINSAIVTITPVTPSVVNCSDHLLLRRVIKAGFSGRRKMLRNALASLAIKDLDINELFKHVNIDPQARAENLSLAQFALLTDAILARTPTAP